LMLVAWFAPRRHRLVWFWTGVAVVAVGLATGDYLPFGLNHLLYRLPIYNLFRGSYRHTYEFTFALAVLAGLGADRLERAEWASVRPVLLRASLVLGGVVTVVALIYRFFAHRLGAAASPSPGAS